MAYPNLYLVGAMKSGTTTVADTLALHPDVYACPIKEPNYFCTDLYAYGLGASAMDNARAMRFVRKGKTLHHAYIRDDAAYQSLFIGRSGQPIVADFSTNYLYSNQAAANIRQAAPDSRILMILRNPVERAFSEFVMNCSIGVAKPPFSHWLDEEQKSLARGDLPVEHRYVSAGLYYGQVKRYLETFPKMQVKIVLHDDLKSDAGKVMDGIALFLGIRPFDEKVASSNPAIYPRLVFLNRIAELSGAKKLIREWVPGSLKDVIKKKYYRAKPLDIEIAEQDRIRLRQHFSDDISRLSGLIERNLDGWHDQ